MNHVVFIYVFRFTHKAEKGERERESEIARARARAKSRGDCVRFIMSRKIYKFDVSVVTFSVPLATAQAAGKFSGHG